MFRLRMANSQARKHKQPMLISFSGMDGAGKSTQISNLRTFAEDLGLKVTQLAFWDDVVVLKPYREGFVQKVFKSEKGIGSPEKPVARRDKNVRGWHLNLARHFLYSLDAMHLLGVANKVHARGADLVIMDRYIYDELANLPLDNPATRAYVRMVMRIVPCPDISFVLDADPVAARARKPEYPVEFLHECRASYLKLADQLGNITVVPALGLADARHFIQVAFRALLEKRRRARAAAGWRAA
jgi:thymidylate kinase